MTDVQTSIRDVQAKLASLLNDKTILIGHSLESDLTSLKVHVGQSERIGHPLYNAQSH